MPIIAHTGGEFIARQNLRSLDTPASTATHTTISHADFLDKILEALELRGIDVRAERYVVNRDGQHFFGLLTLDIVNRTNDLALMLGIRNAHDKMFRASMVAGFNVFVCDNLALNGEFFPMARKHSKHFLVGLTDAIDLGITRVQREFTLINRRVDRWKNYALPDAEAERLIYRAFIRGELDAPARLAQEVHKNYFNPPHEEFAPRNVWSLHNAFTEAAKELKFQPRLSLLSQLDGFLALPDVDGTAEVIEPEPLVEVA